MRSNRPSLRFSIRENASLFVLQKCSHQKFPFDRFECLALINSPPSSISSEMKMKINHRIHYQHFSTGSEETLHEKQYFYFQVFEARQRQGKRKSPFYLASIWNEIFSPPCLSARYTRLHQICIRRNRCSKRSHDEEDERRIIGVCIRRINYSHVRVVRNGVNSKNVAIMYNEVCAFHYRSS